MGSVGHKMDLELAVPAIRVILEQYSHVTFETFGTIEMPEGLKDFADRVYSHKVRRQYAEFLQFLYELEWDVGLAPLADNEFNRCKAPTKFVEYTSCDIPTIASNVLVYNRVINNSNGLLAKNETEWHDSLQALVNHAEMSEPLLVEARKTCASTMSLEILKEQLLKVFELVT